MTTTPIEDYAFLGNRRTAALVSRAGSVDWWCPPAYDSPAAFAALLGGPDHGRWLITPVEEAETTRTYLDDSFALVTTHRTAGGTVIVTDLMPATGEERGDIVRRIEGISGTVVLRHEWTVRPWYGLRRPWVRADHCPSSGADVLQATAGPDTFILHGSPLPALTDDQQAVGELTISRGQIVEFDLIWQPSHLPLCEATPLSSVIDDARHDAAEWLATCDYDGPYRDLVRRSLMVLRHLSDEVTGGIVAAPTTSLPEDFGGSRNWDYRYSWLRDAALTIEALLRAGYQDKALRWRDWLVRAVAGDPTSMQIMYTIRGESDLPERELDHLPGYAGSRPVRIGNGAVSQRQTDVLGEVMVALEQVRDSGIDPSPDSWALQRMLVDDLADHWEDADHGIWEIRGPLHHFTHSRVMVWATFDRAVTAAERYGLDGDVERWRELAATVHAEVLERGYDTDRGTFTQHYDTDEVDASLLLLSQVGFLPADDERIVGTVAAIEQDLLRDGLVLRYRVESGVDGLDGDEHPFLICCFWLVSSYARMGRLDDARELMDRLVALANDVGLLAEESEADGTLIGNFPQAFSHLGLIQAAYDLRDAEQTT